MSEPELKPCPFCGEKPEYKIGGPGHAPPHRWTDSVQCRPCRIGFYQDGAFERWNTRANTATARAE